MVSRDLEKQCVVVFDEAHNIDNVCIEVCMCCLMQHMHHFPGQQQTCVHGA